MAAHYFYGKRKELQVAEFFIRRGFTTARSQGSRGPFDLRVNKGKRRFVVQVKSTRACRIGTNCLSSRDEASLLQAATEHSASVVLALVSRNYVWFLNVPDAAVIGKGRLTPLKRNYHDCT